MATKSIVYYQSSTMWSPIQHAGILALADGSLDAIVFQADELFPAQGENSVIPLIEELNRRGIISIIQPKERANGNGAMLAVQAGAVSLGTNHDDPISLINRISAILKSNQNQDSRRRAISSELYRGPIESDFWHPTFGTDYNLTFISNGKLPHQALLDYLNQIPVGSSIVINCGHIDTPNMKPDPISIETFREGARAWKYLESRGHKNVRLSVLVNDMYEFNKDPHSARTAFDKRRRQYKATGVHDLFPEEYRQILREYGIDLGRWPKVIIPKTETALKFAASQAINSPQRQENHLLVDLVENGGQLAYTIETGNGQYTIPLTSKAGAPVCRMIASQYFRQLEAQGATNVLHLYPLEHECSTAGGVKAARNLYGSRAKHEIFLFAPSSKGIDVMRRDAA